MTQQDKINRLESEFAALKRQVDYITKRLLPNDQEEFNRAMEALMARDPKPLDDYLKSGRKIPCQTAAA